MRVEDIGELVDSTDLIGDPAALRARWDEDGVLFFRNLVNPETINRNQIHFRKALLIEDLIAPDMASLTWTGEPMQRRRVCDTIGLTVWREIIKEKGLNNALRQLLDEEPVWLPLVSHRSSLPTGPTTEDQDIFIGRHQDSFTNEGLPYVINWIPMMDIPRQVGGLTVAVGNHKRGFLHDALAEPKYPIPRDAIPDKDWKTTHYHPGDVLMLHFNIPHVGLPNQSDVVRLSIDLRVIPASAPRPVVGRVTKLDGATVSIDSEEGPIDVLVSNETFIRLENPHPRLRTEEVGRLAQVGARVLATVTEDNRAVVLRPVIYDE